MEKGDINLGVPLSNLVINLCCKFFSLNICQQTCLEMELKAYFHQESILKIVLKNAFLVVFFIAVAVFAYDFLPMIWFGATWICI